MNLARLWLKENRKNVLVILVIFISPPVSQISDSIKSVQEIFSTDLMH